MFHPNRTISQFSSSDSEISNIVVVNNTSFKYLNLDIRDDRIVNTTPPLVKSLIQVDVVVNVLKGVTIKNKDIDEIIEIANGILKKAGVILVVKKIYHDVPDEGNDDGKVQIDDFEKQYDRGIKELEKIVGKSIGYKLILAETLIGAMITMGDVKGATPQDGRPVSLVQVKRIPGTPRLHRKKIDTLGHRVAHEFCHAYEPKDKADKGAHSEDKTNLMHGDAMGDNLTQDQIDEIDLGLEERKEKAEEDEKVGSSWSPPKGTTRIAAVGTVRKEKVMITSRGTIGGTVTLEDEEGEELATAVPDEDGHFNIDFGKIGLGVASTLILKRFDSQGKELTSTPVEYLPEIPSEIVGPPVLTEPDIPYLENNQINELEGLNLGEGTEVVVTDEQGNDILQETLSTTTKNAMYYMDGKVGQAEVRARNEFGISEPLEIGIYEFNVRAGKMNLVRNEKTSITGVYEGLPEGTKIVFTNMSENVTIKPSGKGKTSGNEVTFTVRKNSNEVQLNLKARQSGGWQISYRLEFPESN